MKNALKILIPLVAVLAIASLLLWNFLPPDPKLSTNQERDSRYVGVSSDTSGIQLSSDRNNVFWTANPAKGGVSHTTAPNFFPSILRISNGFAVPDENSILWLSDNLQETTKHSIPSLDTGTLKSSASSANHRQGLFTFNTGTGDAIARTEAVAINKDGIRSINRDHNLSSLTPCDSGDIKWIEYYPAKKSEPEGPGTAKMVTWTIDGNISERKIVWDFPREPAHENKLLCDSAESLIVSEDSDGNPISLLLEDQETRSSVTAKKQASLAHTAPPAKARFSTTHGGCLLLI